MASALKVTGSHATIHEGLSIIQDRQITSHNGRYTLKVQSDGNFVLYCSGHAIWNTGSNGRGTAPYRADLQSDGNFVLYDAHGAAVWNSNSQGRGHGPYHVVVQDDGNTVMYDGSNNPVWSTETAGRS